MKDSRDVFIETVVQKLRIAVRSLARDRHFSIVVVLTLSITFAGLAVMAALVHSVLFKPLPYPQPDRLVVVWEKDDRFPVARGRELRTADFIDFRRDAKQFESIGLYRRSINDVEVNGSPVQAEVWSVSASVLPMLGASAVAGRLFNNEDEEPNAPKTILLSYEYWERSFGRNPGIIGTTMFLPRHIPATIVGVVPPGLQPPAIGTLKTNAQLGFSTPQTFPVIWQVYQPTQDEIAVRTRGSYNGIGRLRRNTSLPLAGEELRALGQNLTRQYPESNSGITPLVSPLIEEVSGEFKSVLWVLLVAIACVLMIGVGNLANLQVVRNTSRYRELSIRAALGASTSRLVTELLTESAVLVSIAGLWGVLAGGLALRALIPLLPAGFPRIGEIAMNGTAMMAVFAAGVIATVALGAIPALRIRRADGLDTLQTWSRSTASKYQTAIRRTVIAIETALAFVLLISAGLLLNSWYRLVTTPTGLDETNVTAVSLSLSPKYATRDQQVAFFLKALDATRTYGAIDGAGIVTSPPLAGLESMWPEIRPKEREGQTGSGVTLSLRAVTPDYFRVFRIAPLQGEIFSGKETTQSEQVIMLNESGARALFGTEDPIGNAIVSFGISYRVIGVVPDVKMRRLDVAATPQAYASYLQRPSGSDAPVTIVFRTKDRDRNISTVIRTRIAALDPEVAVTTNTLGDIRWQKTATERFRTTLFLLFALVALVLSLIGIFGLVSYAVAQRRREIGIRIAIGANTKSVIYLMMGQSLIPAGIGILMGFVASLWLTRFISGFVFAISTTDTATIVATALVFASTACLASYIPARRATRIDPWTTLRHE